MLTHPVDRTLGPTSRKLRERVQGDVARLLQQNPEAPRVIPADLVTTSASGLDPHISLAAAQWQVPASRVPAALRLRESMPSCRTKP